MIVTIQKVVSVAAVIVVTMAVATASIQKSEISTGVAASVVSAKLPVSGGRDRALIFNFSEYQPVARLADPALARQWDNIPTVDTETLNVLRVFGAVIAPTALIALISLKLAIPFGMLAMSFGTLVLGYLNNKKYTIE